MNTLIKAKNINLEYNSRDVLSIESLSIANDAKIGLIGINGSGKSSLMKILVGEMVAEGARIQTKGSIAYVAQKASPDASMDCSGGEAMRLRIGQAFAENAHALFLDEPTNNLDQEAIASLSGNLKYFPGAVLVISHDRHFLNDVVDTIWELDEGKITVYQGNYTFYETQKEAEQKYQNNQYESYLEKKKKLEMIAKTHRDQAQKGQKTKINTTNQGGRLAHAKGTDTKQKAMMRKAKEVERRIESLESISKPPSQHRLNFRMDDELKLNNAFPIMGRELSVAFGDKRVISNFDFDIKRNQKVALRGSNGSGKTTLIKAILNQHPGITIAPKVVIGYYAQDSIQELPDQVVLTYLKEGSSAHETQLRAVLAALGFAQKDAFKQTQSFSGGEQVKLCLAKLFCGKYNLLILDEPANNLDHRSIKALESLLQAYQGTLVMVSHDRHLLESVCDTYIDL